MPRTPKGRALGNALRQARLDHGVTVRQFAAALERDPGVLSRWETGERTPRPEQVARMLTTLGVNGARYEEIIALAYDTDDTSWVATTLPAQRQQLAALLDLEKNAKKITEVSPLLVPGILQTSDYIRAMMISDGLPPTEVESRMAVRIGRREIITRPKPAKLVVLLGHAALWQVIGNRAVMVEQLRHLLEMARLPSVELRAIPFSAGWHPALEGSFALIEPEHEKPVVAMENRRSGLFFHEDGDVRTYQHAVAKVLEAALDPVDSARLVASLAERMEKSQ